MTCEYSCLYSSIIPERSHRLRRSHAQEKELDIAVSLDETPVSPSLLLVCAAHLAFVDGHCICADPLSPQPALHTPQCLPRCMDPACQ